MVTLQTRLALRSFECHRVELLGVTKVAPGSRGHHGAHHTDAADVVRAVERIIVGNVQGNALRVPQLGV